MRTATERLLAVILALLAAMALFGCGEKEEEREMTNGPVYDGVALPQSLWTAPAWEEEPSRVRTEEIRGIWYDTVYQGKPTKAFAYLGIPEGASAEAPAPAVLLLHGGAGTAYWEWVASWVERGYVALAPDLEGHVPTQEGTMSSYPAELYTRSEYPAPQNVNYADAALPMEETWMYYAVSTATLGNSLLHGLPEADPQRIGVCGVSWGGVITSIVTGYDDRYAFSVPIYCSLNIVGSGGNLGSYYDANPEALVWDDDKGLAKVNTPILFYASNVDAACSALAVSKTYERCKNARLILVDGLPHSQVHAAAAIEPYLFADSIVKDGPAFSRATAEPDAQNPVFVYAGEAGVQAKLWYTSDDITQGQAVWSPMRCPVSGTSVTAAIPEGAAWYYFSVDDGGSGICSRIVKCES